MFDNFGNIDFQQILNDQLIPWIIEKGPIIIVVLVIALIAGKFARTVVEKIIRKAIRSSPDESPKAEEQRENTLIEIFDYTFNIILFAAVGMVLLSELGVDIGPLIAGAGIAGIAVGFGGQFFIRDIIAGFFITLENQYRVGDVVDLNGKSGVVEDISLRVTTLRDMDGIVHSISNGEITVSSNMTKQFSKINIDLGIAYDSDLEKVIKIIDKVGEDLSKDKEWEEDIIESPHFLRVDEFGDSAIMVKIVGKTQPLKQWATAGEFRKRLKIAFDKNNIEIPFPQRVIHYADKPKAKKKA